MSFSPIIDLLEETFTRHCFLNVYNIVDCDLVCVCTWKGEEENVFH